MAELSAGATFAGHEILGVAGRGGMGVVYRARDLRLKREVALKVITPEQSAEQEFRTRFRRECEVAASLHHPNLIPVYTAGEHDGHLYVTMRYVDGIDLALLIDRTGRLEPEQAAYIIAQVAHALDAAHAFGVVHRDVKPANVLLDGDHALLTDFGLQRDLNATTRVTEPGTLIGSFDYTAPEQLEDADVDARTDVYALGCVLYEAITGEVPFPRETPAAKMYAHLGAPVPTLEGPLNAVIQSALAKHPDDRFASAGALGRAALEAVGTRATRSSPPKPAPLPPALLAESGEQPFVGRAHHRERIEHHLAAALDGERRFVVIEGEPGIGKTRLATEAARDAHAAGTTVLYGRCDPDSLIPYQPFAMALPSVKETERFAFFDAVTRQLARHPTLLILDDLHWADPATMQLLAHVLGDPEPMRLLVLATSRAGNDRLPSPSERLTLTGLERHELSALVVALGERTPTADALRRLHERTAGNPFFVAETLRAEGLPDTIREVITRRLADLDERTRTALTIAAVMGRGFRLDVLETLAEDALEAVEAACAEGLVRETEQVDHFLFAHALVRETLYDSMSNARRVRMHQRIGEALEQFAAPPGELARHFYAARHLDGGEKALSYSILAAQQGDFEEAAAHYRHALELGEPRLDLLLDLGRAELRAGEPTARATFTRAAALAREAADPDALAHAALGFNARQAASGVLDDEGIALLEEADARVADGPLRARVKARLADALHFADQPDRTLALSADALALAGEDPEAQAAALVARHTALLHVEHLDERLDLARQIIAAGDPELVALGRWWYVYDLLEAGDTEAAREQHEALARLADDLRQPLFRHFATAWEVVWAQMGDRPADIQPLADRAYELGLRAAAPDAAMIHATQLMALRLQQGRLGDYLDTVRPLAEAFPHLTGWRAALAIGLILAGRREEGEAVYASLAVEDVPRDMQWSSTLALLSWACTLLGDGERAPALHEALLPYRHRTVQDVLAANWGSIERFLGSLSATAGDLDQAAEHYERALERNAGNPQALRLTRAEYASLRSPADRPPRPAAR